MRTNGFYLITWIIYVSMAQRETGLVQQIFGFIWMAMVLLSGGFFVADVEQPFLVVTTEFLMHHGLFGTSLFYLDMMLQTVPEPFINSMDSDRKERRDNTTSSHGMDGDNVPDGGADRFRKLFGHGKAWRNSGGMSGHVIMHIDFCSTDSIVTTLIQFVHAILICSSFSSELLVYISMPHH